MKSFWDTAGEPQRPSDDIAVATLTAKDMWLQRLTWAAADTVERTQSIS